MDLPALSTGFSSDFIWNTASFFIMAVVGLSLNFIIASAYDTTVVGVFNQVYALYFLFSQFAAGGIHLSVLKNVSQFSGDDGTVAIILSSGITLSAIVAVAVCGLVFLTRGLFSALLGSPDVGLGILYSIPGLLLFSINKTILAYFNGMQHLRAYAVFQAVRFLAILLTLVLFVLFQVEGSATPAIFSVAEFVLFGLLLAYLFLVLHVELGSAPYHWYKKHLVFGIKAVLGNILLDVNTQVNVLVLGIFSSDLTVGIFSFAARFAEGFSQFPVVVRTIINPKITKAWYEESSNALEKLMDQYKKLTYKILIPFGILMIGGYPALGLLIHNGQIAESWGAFAIMMSGLLFSAGYLPFVMVFNQTGYPGHQTIYLLYFFLTNLVLNVLLVWLAGMYGAAIATGLTFVIQLFFFRKMVWFLLKVRV